MGGLRIPAFWQALGLTLIAYLVFDNAFPPVLPRSLMIQYMLITVVGILLYFAFDDDLWAEFKAPILATLRDDNKAWLRWCLLVAVPALSAYISYQSLKPSLDAPVELRQVHPAPPATVKAYGKTYDLATLDNPVRSAILETFAEDRDAGWAAYDEAVLSGRDVYYQNCYFCHGDLLDGTGPFADGINPKPINFQDPTIIPQLQEAFLFWRIATGGPGLPKEGTPWNSAMPVWHEMLSEQEIWQLLMFVFDYNGQVPRIWDPAVSKAVTAIKDDVVAKRKAQQGEDLYQFRCAVCHGDTGAGDGAATEVMTPKPRDFSLGLFKYKTSPGTLLPRDEDLINTIKYGLPGTAMPGWGLPGSALLSDAQIRSLIPVIKRFDITLSWPPEDADDDAFDEDGFYLHDDFQVISATEPLPDQQPYSDDSIAQGKVAFEKSCSECHGMAGRGNILSGKNLEDDWGYRIWPRDLTKPWTWRASQSRATDETARDETIQAIYTRLSTGILGTPMPAHRAVEAGNTDPVNLADRWHIANYVYSLRDTATPPSDSAVLEAVPLAEPLPTEVNDPRWQHANPVTLRLVPNIIKATRLFTPLNDAVTVRSLYNDDDIAFLLEINDRTESRPGIDYFTDLMDDALEMHADASAIQFPKAGAYTSAPMVEKPLYRHGDAKHPTTIWYWNAGSVEPAQDEQAMLFDASGPDKPLNPRADARDLKTHAQWHEGQWKIIFKRPRFGGSDDLAFVQGEFIPVSFANWDGSNGEVGAQHTLTGWYWLVLPEAVNPMRVYGVPAGVAMIVFFAGLGWVRRQRRAHAEASHLRHRGTTRLGPP